MMPPPSLVSLRCLPTDATHRVIANGSRSSSTPRGAHLVKHCRPSMGPTSHASHAAKEVT